MKTRALFVLISACALTSILVCPSAQGQKDTFPTFPKDDEITLVMMRAEHAPVDYQAGVALQEKRMTIDRLSVTSLLLKVLSTNQTIGTATGFVVQKGTNYYLVTNWHVVSAKNPNSGASLDPQGRIPDQLQILHNRKGRLGQWLWITEELFDHVTHAPRWIEHPQLGRRADLVLLPLTVSDDVDFYPLDLELRSTPIRLMPAAAVSVVGFPFGHASGAGLPIWKSGTIASDPDVDYENTPQFLVDATGRPGMSGSPVYARRIGTFLSESGVNMAGSGSIDRFLGVYAGDIDQFSEIGRVWKAAALMEIYNSLPPQ